MRRLLKLKSTGDDVKHFQKKLKDYNLYHGNLDGYYSISFQESVVAFQLRNKLNVSGVLDFNTQNLINKVDTTIIKTELPILYMGDNGLKIYNSPIPKEKYYSIKSNKNTIILANTNRLSYDMDYHEYWMPILDKNSNPLPTAHHYTIDLQGKVFNHFDDSFWAYSYIMENENIASQSIIIDVVNYGHLIKRNNTYYTITNEEIPHIEVYNYDNPYKGYSYWHKYNDRQLQSIALLTKYLKNKWQMGNFDIVSDDMFRYHAKWSTLGGLRFDSQIIRSIRGINPQPSLIDAINL